MPMDSPVTIVDATAAADIRDPGARPTIVIPTGARLGSTITYSDLSGGYEPVAREVEAVAEERDGKVVYVAKRWVRFAEDPDSVAAIVASPGKVPGTFHPQIVITHRKLRYMVRDAIKWYLRAQQGTQVPDKYIVFSTKDLDKEQYQRNLPEHLGSVNVHPGDLVFAAPSIEQVPIIVHAYHYLPIVLYVSTAIGSLVALHWLDVWTGIYFMAHLRKVCYEVVEVSADGLLVFVDFARRNLAPSMLRWMHWCVHYLLYVIGLLSSMLLRA